MQTITRRTLLKSSIAGVAATGCFRRSLRLVDSSRAPARDAFISPSVSGATRTFLSTNLAEYAAKIGLRGVDLLQPDEYEIPRRYGLVCTMGYAGRRRNWQGAQSRRESCRD